MTDIEVTPEISILENNEERPLESKDYYFQVDFLKAVMIFLVIFDHMVAWSVKDYIGVALWERISIPIFLVLLGFNMGNSFKQKGDLTLKQLYSKEYFKRKFFRYIVPFLTLYFITTIYGFIWYKFDITTMYHGQYYPSHGFMNLFIGIMPFWGPGNWFLPLLFQSILIMPLLYKGFTKKPVLTLILCFIIEIIMQLRVFLFIGEITSWEEFHIYKMFASNIFFYLSAVGLGMWFSFGYELEDNRNFFMWFLYPISLAYLIAYQFFDFQYMIRDVPLPRGDYHFLVFPYSAFLFLLVMRFLPQTSEKSISKAISLIGKSTYHILLIQIFGYGMIFALYGDHYGIKAGFTLIDIFNLILVWILFIPFGIWWYKIDQGKVLWKRILFTIILFTVFISLTLFILWIGYTT
ncbi:MAG: acyltransferase family protein [Promethearchaeota archaeon]